MSDALGLVALLAIGLAIAAAWLTIATAWLLTHPTRRTYASMLRVGKPGDPSELDPPRRFESFTVMIDGTRLDAWSIAGNNSTGPVAIVTHGWGDGKVGALTRLEAITPYCSRVIAWDLPGHGDSAGSCRLGLVEPELLVGLVEHLSIGGPIVLYGWSLGGGVGIVAASRLPSVRAVIAEAPYRVAPTPARNVLTIRRLPRLPLPIALWLVSIATRRSFAEFDRAEHAARLENIVLTVIHGEHDEVCPVEDGRAVAEAGGGECRVIPAGRHNNLWSEHRSATMDAVRESMLRASTGSEPSAR